MAKILAIQGSPHRGNTYDRVERFGEALTSLGGIDFEHLPLKDMKLEACRGCHLCFDRGEDTCPAGDDKAEIGWKLDEADGVIFATPVYSMHISCLLKRFVDRFACLFHRQRYFDAFAIGLAVTGGVGLKEARGYIRMFAGAWGFRYLGDLRYVDVPRNTALVPLMKEKDRTDEMARRFHRAVTKKPPHKLIANDYLHFHPLRAVYGRMEQFSPTDYTYWKKQGWLEKGISYFTPHAEGNILKSLYPRFPAWMLGRNIDKQNAGRRVSIGTSEGGG